MAPGKRTNSKNVNGKSDNRKDGKCPTPQIRFKTQTRKETVAKKRKSESKSEGIRMPKKRKHLNVESGDDGSYGKKTERKKVLMSEKRRRDERKKEVENQGSDDKEDTVKNIYDSDEDDDYKGDNDDCDDADDEMENTGKQVVDDDDDDDEDDDDEEEGSEELESDDDGHYSRFDQHTNDLLVERVTGIKQYSDRELGSASEAEYIADLCDGEDDSF